MSAFTARMAELRKSFGSPPKVKLVAATLRPKNPADPAGDWEGQAQLRMHGESAAGAPAEVTAVLDYVMPHPTEAALAAGGWLRGGTFAS